METNPISFRQIYDFTDATGVVKPAIEAMQQLSLTSKEFFDIVTNGNLDKLTEEMTRIKDAVTQLAATTEKANAGEKEGQKIILDSTNGVQKYQEQLKQLNDQKQADVKMSKAQQDAVDMLNSSLTSQLKRLQEMEAQGKQTSAGYVRLTQDIKDNTASLENLTKNIQSASGAATGQTEEMKQLALVLEKIIVTTAKLNIADTEEVATLTEKILALQLTNKELKLNSVLADENAGQYAKALAQKEFLVLQYKAQADVTDEVSVAIKANIDVVDQWIKANSYQSAQQRLTIGDYKNAREELTLTIERMRELVIAGEQQGAEYTKLNARAVELTIANKEVTQSIKEQTNAQERLAAVEKENLRIAALYIAEINNEAIAHEKEAAAAIAASEKQAAAIEANTVLYKLQQFVVRDLFRLLASFLTIIPIMAAIEGVQKLYEWFTKLSDAEQLAKDRLDEYNESAKTLQKTTADLKENILSAVYFDESKAKSQVSILKDHNLTLSQRFLAYQALQTIAPNILDGMDKEGFKVAENTERMNTQLGTLQKYIELQERIAKGRENQQKEIEVQQKNADQLDAARAKVENLIPQSMFTKGKTVEQVQASTGSLSQPMHEALDDLNKLQKEKNKLDAEAISNDEYLLKLEHERAALEGNTKDKKGRKHSDKNDMEAELANEKQQSEARLLSARTEFQNSAQTFEDSKKLHKAEEDETQLHYDNVKNILLKYHGNVGESEAKYSARQTEAANDSIKAYDAAAETVKMIDKEVQERHIQAMKDMDEYIAKLRAGRAEIAKLTGELEALQKSNAIKLANAKDTNPVLAALGVANTKGDLATSQALKQVSIDKDKDAEDVSRTALADEGVKGQGADPIKLNELTEKVLKDKLQTEKDSAAKELEMAEAREKGKQAAYQKTFELGTTLANAAFDHTKQVLQRQMEATQKLGDFETELAGNNSVAKLKIERDTQKNLLAEKRKEAEVTKEQGIMNATISTLVAVAKAYEGYPWPFDLVVGALVGAAGLVEVGKIANTPLPQYAKGRTNGPAEYARVNEEGPEAIERKGKYLFAGGGKDTVTKLEAGDTVHTYSQTVKMLSAESNARNWVNNLLSGTGAHVQVEHNKQEALIQAMVNAHLSKNDLEQATYKGMSKAIDKMPKQGRAPLPGQLDRWTRQQVRNGL